MLSQHVAQESIPILGSWEKQQCKVEQEYTWQISFENSVQSFEKGGNFSFACFVSSILLSQSLCGSLFIGLGINTNCTSCFNYLQYYRTNGLFSTNLRICLPFIVILFSAPTTWKVLFQLLEIQLRAKLTNIPSFIFCTSQWS